MHKGLCGDSYLQNTNMLGDRASNIPQIIFFCLEFFLIGLNQRISDIIGKAPLVFNKSWFSCLLSSKEMVQAYSAI